MRRVLLLAAAVSLVCAALMFFALRNRDDSLFLYAEAATRSANSSHESTPAKDTAVSELPNAGTSHVAGAPAPALNEQEAAPWAKRTFFKIRRSRRFQSLGPVRVRFSRVNPVRPDLDVSLNVNGHRVEKKHVGVDQPITIEASKNAPAVEIVFNRITKDRVSGYVSQ
jgi:hypothetical protein